VVRSGRNAETWDFKTETKKQLVYSRRHYTLAYWLRTEGGLQTGPQQMLNRGNRDFGRRPTDSAEELNRILDEIVAEEEMRRQDDDPGF